ncbi:extracellular solute-binding protein [Amycolatopsis sp. EV170708-02-1]|uniref:extracellular solute-binding protein n=1 Tax=Amycolatopsis sp. EV170708-02-1 TaxID=2919322 RepID=UPI001F0B77E3|nr:extracellular solute-binding protein [Amycolatopsis sp. EV170708-02-1]UMP00112.1 extracellular solute-binding protein [Amycolatopsis sp. EV170708-02-1]
MTIYASRPKNIADRVVARFEAANPQYKGKVKMLTMGAQEVLERVRAEAGRPQADIWWGGTSQQFEQGVAAGLLAPMPSAAARRVPLAYHGRNDLWLGEMRMAQVIFYNRDMLTPEQAPKDWDDLVTPAFRDKVLIRDVAASGTMRSAFSAMVDRSFARTGSPEQGYEWLRALDANTKEYVPNPSDLYLRVQRREAPVSVWNLQDILVQQKKGAPFTPVIPASGAPILIDGVGKVKGGPNGAAADAFVDFLFQEPIQQELAETSFQIPTLRLSREPAWLTAIGLKEMPVDWATVNQREHEWITYWSEHIKGHRR